MTATMPRRRETWVDWEPPDKQIAPELLTRDELIERIGELGFRVTDRDLRFWETKGVIPQAVRRWHKGSTRAVYPDWMAAAVAMLRDLTEIGYSLEMVAETIRANFFHGPPIGVAIVTHFGLFDTNEFGQMVGRQALRYAKATDQRVTSVDITVRGENGRIIYTKSLAYDQGPLNGHQGDD